MDNSFVVRCLEHEAQQRAAFELMRELRPYLNDIDQFVRQLARQAQQGYRLLGTFEGHHVIGLVGFREMENLIYGRFIYVDDLIVNASRRQRGFGAALLDAVRDEIRTQGCVHLVLDTGLHMPLAQRFYFREGLLAKGLHVVQSLLLPEHPGHA
ncbi:GNAT family N-acetyltransferase [Pseudomonas sp. LTJR-52]|uniref:GNAT family N-acetyltransferase n=1 Tax=Pseudomonas sp. LTJR-52 TaxID=2479392 RepID=UPI000EFD4F49|nr:GNAT family N-acetyltransferase [Pseudomonas sp. LTJR-52]AYN96246.1 GNAT family N-acetyltransferase [Pseudomonas sp. LTJR-52]